ESAALDRVEVGAGALEDAPLVVEEQVLVRVLLLERIRTALDDEARGLDERLLASKSDGEFDADAFADELLGHGLERRERDEDGRIRAETLVGALEDVEADARVGLRPARDRLGQRAAERVAIETEVPAERFHRLVGAVEVRVEPEEADVMERAQR